MKRLFLCALVMAALPGCGHRPQSEEAKRGRDHMQYYGCVSCHSIPGVPGAHGMVGPPLDHLGLRTYLAGTLPNSQQNLSLWIQHPQRIHPGSAMPELNVKPEDATEIARYLEELR